jgi:DNA-binding transcriptional LysR family regulator
MASSTLPSLEAFCRTYETSSFTKAARLLGVTPQATSRSIARLEVALGATLFLRTTRRLAATDVGHRYYAIASQALSLLEASEEEIRKDRRAPEGRVRISVPTTYGHHRLLPSLGAFRERYPAIRVELDVANRNVDFVRDGCDLAIRMGVIAASGLVARKLGDFALGVYGAPLYFARYGIPKEPDDLAQHTCIAFVMPSSGRLLPWSLGSRRFVPGGAYRCSDDPLGTLTLARAGVGLVQTYDFLVEEDVKRARLVEVLRETRGVTRAFSLVYPKRPAPSRAARTMIEFILKSREI